MEIGEWLEDGYFASAKVSHIPRCQRRNASGRRCQDEQIVCVDEPAASARGAFDARYSTCNLSTEGNDLDFQRQESSQPRIEETSTLAASESVQPRANW